MENKKINKPKFNPYWIYGIVITVLLAMSMFGGDNNWQSISKTNISDKGLFHLGKLQKLESLNLFKTEVSKELLTVIPRLPHLKRLYLSESNATNEIVSQLKINNQNLKIIND